MASQSAVFCGWARSRKELTVVVPFAYNRHAAYDDQVHLQSV
ncbi:hypothetical protein O1L55_30105 [Streptomyces albulus]|nr:hypothetical protein [Streptomyces noursei]